MYHLDAQTQTTLARERAATLRSTMVAGQRPVHTTQRKRLAGVQPQPRVRSSLFRGFRTLRRLQPGEH